MYIIIYIYIHNNTDAKHDITCCIIQETDYGINQQLKQQGLPQRDFSFVGEEYN